MGKSMEIYGEGGCMLSLFFLFNFSFTIQNALFLPQNFRVAIQKSLCTTIIP